MRTTEVIQPMTPSSTAATARPFPSAPGGVVWCGGVSISCVFISGPLVELCGTR
ncbi:hypothetical protein [Streptomyces sp. WAC07149]|uniref:hypothetical protein n=1 Tax=Streptomyces sp. WAC07149 TaxID=2487425 RepID=UPI00163C019C|nr:hypothetical protein [Streptomyces sp. WAC07149]